MNRQSIGDVSLKSRNNPRALPVRVSFVLGKIKYAKHFRTIDNAVSYVWAGSKGCRLEGGQFFSPHPTGFVRIATFHLDGRKLTTDDLVPALKRVRLFMMKKQASTAAALAKLDRLDAEDRTARKTARK